MITNIDLKNKEKNKGTLKQRDTHFVLRKKETKGHSLCFKVKKRGKK
jgi:hypothetical protein